jgi:signal transduction histidine kinase
MGIFATACQHSAMVPAVSRSHHPARLASFALWSAAFGFGLLSVLIARSHPGTTFGAESWRAGLVELTAGWALIGAGLDVWWRRRRRRSGLLLAAAGAAWFFAEWNNPDIGVGAAFTFGLVAFALAPPVVAHAVLAYPSGRVSSRLERLGVAVAYVGAGLVLGLLRTLSFDPSRQACNLCPPNLLLIHGRPGWVESLDRWGLWLGAVWAIGIVALCVWRLARSSASLRRVTTPVLVAGAGYLMLIAWDFVHSLPRGALGNDRFEVRLWFGQAVALCAIALGVAWSWLLDRRTRTAMARLVVEMGGSPRPGRLREALAGSLGDPELELAYPLVDPERLVDAKGTIVDPASYADRVVTPLARDGATVAQLVHRAGLLDDRAVHEVVAATRLGLESERLQAEVLAHLEDLRASRARIVATGDAERRRLERNLHDGAQQRLVGLSLALRLARTDLGDDRHTNISALIDRAEEGLRVAIDELRELAHGIYPAVLTDEGLAAAAEALAERSSIPIAIAHVPEERFPSPVEAAAYFLIAEAAGSIAVLAGADSATVDVRRDGNRLLVEVTDDGVSDPDTELETRIVDLADRVGALEGRIRIEQVPAGAITIRAEIPCES